MFISMMSMFIMLLISSLLMFLANLLSKKCIKNREKSSPFECGFDPKSSARMPFSLQFFLIALIFLIFDVEITLILPFIVTMMTSNTMNFLLLIWSFLMILLMGLFHEWHQGALKWAY